MFQQSFGKLTAFPAVRYDSSEPALKNILRIQVSLFEMCVQKKYEM